MQQEASSGESWLLFAASNYKEAHTTFKERAVERKSRIRLISLDNLTEAMLLAYPDPLLLASSFAPTTFTSKMGKCDFDSRARMTEGWQKPQRDVCLCTSEAIWVTG